MFKGLSQLLSLRGYCILVLISFFCFMNTSVVVAQELPDSFDLRDYNGENYVSSVKDQQGGTCWTHATMAAIESNLMMTGVWTANGESGQPNLAEYHLDWWNGFNQHYNRDVDPPSGTGLVVHEGGDYLVASAYLSRSDGAVRDVDGQSYYYAPEYHGSNYHYYYPRDVVWMTTNYQLDNIESIKQTIMEHGAIGTCVCWDYSFYSTQDNIFYQPSYDDQLPNHAVTIIGWNDSIFVPNSLVRGAWLTKNSWGSNWGDDGYFWISYMDKYCCKHPEMGAVSFQNVEPFSYARVYLHDYHGWRGELTAYSKAFNKFRPSHSEALTAFSLYTTTDNVTYTFKVYDDFLDGELQQLLSTQTGVIDETGFHTIDLVDAVQLTTNDYFYLYLEISDGGLAYDRTSSVPVLLGASYRVVVPSTADPDQSYYYDENNQQWKDLYDFNSTANFCIKGLTKRFSIIDAPPDGYENLYYEYDLKACGGLEPYSWNLIEGTLPAGLTFENGTDGVIKGTPNHQGDFAFSIELADANQPSWKDTVEYQMNISELVYTCGDANTDFEVDISDAVFLINYIFVPDSPVPFPYIAGDVNCDLLVDVSDAVHIINYVFVPDSPEPCECKK